VELKLRVVGASNQQLGALSKLRLLFLAAADGFGHGRLSLLVGLALSCVENASSQFAVAFGTASTRTAVVL
jgi:hypothetical protein